MDKCHCSAIEFLRTARTALLRGRADSDVEHGSSSEKSVCKSVQDKLCLRSDKEQEQGAEQNQQNPQHPQAVCFRAHTERCYLEEFDEHNWVTLFAYITDSADWDTEDATRTSKVLWRHNFSACNIDIWVCWWSRTAVNSEFRSRSWGSDFPERSNSRRRTEGLAPNNWACSR